MANPTGLKVPHDRLMDLVAGEPPGAAVARSRDADNPWWRFSRGLERLVLPSGVHVPRRDRVAGHGGQGPAVVEKASPPVAATRVPSRGHPALHQGRVRSQS